MSHLSLSTLALPRLASARAIGGLEDRGDGMGVMACWNSSTLEMIRFRVTEQRDMPWVAVDPETRSVWSASWGEETTFNIWSSETFELLDTYSLPEGLTLPKEIQGAGFYQGDLYLATNVDDAVWRLERGGGEGGGEAKLSMVVSDMADTPQHEYEMEVSLLYH
jgi:hypothetical protein